MHVIVIIVVLCN